MCDKESTERLLLAASVFRVCHFATLVINPNIDPYGRRIVEVPEGRISPDYLPQPQQYEAEMEHYRQTGDHARFAAAYNAFHKESRAANLLSLGEFDDEG